MLLYRKRNVVLQVIYFMPDYPSLMQEFIWGYQDTVPDFLKTHEFLNHWHCDIQAVINQVFISVDQKGWQDYRNVINLQQMN